MLPRAVQVVHWVSWQVEVSRSRSKSTLNSATWIGPRTSLRIAKALFPHLTTCVNYFHNFLTLRDPRLDLYNHLSHRVKYEGSYRPQNRESLTPHVDGGRGSNKVLGT